MFLLIDGEWNCCGYNYNGKLGLGHKNKVSSFTKMKFKFPSPIYQFIQGTVHNLVLLENGDIYVWGFNYFGQLGLNDDTDRKMYTRLNFKFPSPVIRLFTKYHYNFALLKNGDIYGWGENSKGQLGLKDKKNRLKPTKLNFSFPSSIRSIHCGRDFTLFLLGNNQIYVCGFSGRESVFGDTLQRLEPIQLKFNFSSSIQHIECGYFHCLILLESDEIYGWGENFFGQLGLEDDNISIPTKLNYFFPFPVQNVYCKNNTSYALLENGQLYGWGRNNYGQLGVGDMNNRNIPTLIPISFPVKDFYCRVDSCFAIFINNGKQEIYGWGLNSNGELGLGDEIDRLTPTLIPLSASNIEFYPSPKDQWKPNTHQFQSAKNCERIEIFLQLHHTAVPFLILEEIIQFL